MCTIGVCRYHHWLNSMFSDWIPCFLFYSSSSKFRVSNGIIGLPYHVSQGVGCQLRGQNCFVEVSLGFPRSETDKALQSNKNTVRSLPKSPVMGHSDHKGSPDHLSDNEKTFLYPAESVLVPVFQTSLARSSLRRYFFFQVLLFFLFFN
jgi:mediator of RNA polymerase II transcription subunit 13